jgi:hypothetical protein
MSNTATRQSTDLHSVDLAEAAQVLQPLDLDFQATDLPLIKPSSTTKKLPHVNARIALEGAPSESDDLRNPIFELLVQNEQDVAGLLAYALYKQNKRDWLIAFQATTGRQPTDAEVSAFILGERIPRRTSTYRKLAEDMLVRSEGKPGLLAGLMAQPANDTGGGRPVVIQAKKNMLMVRYIGIMLVLLVIMAVAFRFAATWLFGR